MRKRWVPSPAIGLSFVALMVALGGVTVAAIPGPDGVIHACYANSNLVTQLGAGAGPLTQVITPQGALRVIDSSASCPSGETALNFNQAGPPGSGMPMVYAERTQKSITVGTKMTTVLSASLPAGSYEVIGSVQFREPHPPRIERLAECSVTGPSNEVITGSTVAQTLAAGGGAEEANLAINTVVDQMPAGLVSVECEDTVDPGATQTEAGIARAAAGYNSRTIDNDVGLLLMETPVNEINACGGSAVGTGSNCVTVTPDQG
jgi:hypothetical protein